MHNLNEQDWLNRKNAIEPWAADTTTKEQQQIQTIITKMANAKIGKNCFIAPDCNFFTDKATLGNSVKIASLATLRGNISLGNDVSVNPLTNIIGNVSIGNAVRIASSVQIFGFNHGFSRIDKYIKDQPITSLGITIGDGTWIGAGAKILDGVTIGSHCIVAAGAVVTKSQDSFSIIAGNPAKAIRSRLGTKSKQVELITNAKRGNNLDFCIDLPATHYLDGNNATLDGWIATSAEIDGLFLISNEQELEIPLNKNRDDVKAHLKIHRRTLFKNGTVLGFTTPPLESQHKIVLKTKTNTISLYEIKLNDCS